MDNAQLVLQFISVGLGLVTAVLLHRSYKLNAQIDKLNSQMRISNDELRKISQENEKMREFGRQSTSLAYDYVDALVLGPRDSGKSSLVRLWSTPWVNVKEVAPSGKWATEEFSLHEFEPSMRFDETFGFPRNFKPVLRVRIRDYPGEDYLRIPAIREIKKLDKRVVLVFVMKVGFDGDNFVEAARNEGYFSRTFLDEVEVILGKIGSAVARVLIVFNKSDLVPDFSSEGKLVDYLKSMNRKTVERLESTFGGLTDYVATSAETNLNVIKLLGMIASTGIQTTGDEVKLDLALRAIENQIRKHV